MVFFASSNDSGTIILIASNLSDLLSSQKTLTLENGPMMSMTSNSLPPLTPNKKISRGESGGSTLTTGTSAIWEDEMGAASDQLFFVTSYR
jgi:hypothetical protein